MDAELVAAQASVVRLLDVATSLVDNLRLDGDADKAVADLHEYLDIIRKVRATVRTVETPVTTLPYRRAARAILDKADAEAAIAAAQAHLSTLLRHQGQGIVPCLVVDETAMRDR